MVGHEGADRTKSFHIVHHGGLQWVVANQHSWCIKGALCDTIALGVGGTCAAQDQLGVLLQQRHSGRHVFELCM